jgi:isopenicillin N synthase-like dioxygenase
MSDMSMFFMRLIAESLDLPSNAFEKFFDENQQHKLKIVKYPGKQQTFVYTKSVLVSDNG